jgi:hypothetical protein
MDDKQFLKALQAAVCSWQTGKFPSEPSKTIAPVLIAIEKALQQPIECPTCHNITEIIII